MPVYTWKATQPENTLLDYYRRITNPKATLKNGGSKEVENRLILEVLEEKERREKGD